MGRTVLAYQFVAGLLPDIWIKVAGTEGIFDQLLMKARFKEAKLRDLGPLVQTPTRPPGMLTAMPNSEAQENLASQGTKRKCFVCGQVGHLARECSLQRRGQPVEAGGLQHKSSATNTPHSWNQSGPTHTHYVAEPEDQQSSILTEVQEKVWKLRQELQAAELQEALVKKTASICVVQPCKEVNPQDVPSLGPTV